MLPPNTTNARKRPSSISSAMSAAGHSPSNVGMSGRAGGPGDGGALAGRASRESSCAKYPGLNHMPPGRSNEPVSTSSAHANHSTAFPPEEPFAKLVTRVRETTLNALSNDDAPFGYLVSHFDQTRKTGLNPFFGVMFSLEPPLSPLSPGWSFTQMDVETDISKVDLHMELDEREEGLIGRFIYSTELFQEKTIRGMTASWLSLADLIAQEPNRSVSDLSERLDTEAPVEAPRPISLLERFRKLWR